MNLSFNRRRKYGNSPTAGYDSRRERSRGFQLQALQQAGRIANLRRQVRYELIPAQRGADGKVVERSCSYVADFVYTDLATGRTVVEDVKGFRTPDYVIKRKLMLYLHHISITEV